QVRPHQPSLHGCQVPSVVDDQMPLHLHVCYPTARPEVLRAAAAKPSEQLNVFSLLAKDKSESCSAWRGALSSLTRETFGVGGDGSSGDGAVPERPGRTRAGGAATVQSADGPPGGRGDAAATSAIGKLELLQGSVISMLCRILQTQDRAAVQAWLMAASPRERELVTDIIQSSVANRDEYFVHLPHRVQAANARARERLSPTDSGSGGDGATKPSTAAESAGNSASSSRQPPVQLSLEGGLTGTGKPWAARAAALTPVTAAGRRTSLPSLLAGKAGDHCASDSTGNENRRFKKKN
uniref:PH domain-containing protein n=1 Tax=Macrostomum lignano TaxID=282301 RepID=A0A1I8F9U4_9PLAT